MTVQDKRIGVLAIQGDVEAHARAIEALGAEPVRVLRDKHLDGLDGLVLPGGESTTVAKGLERLWALQFADAQELFERALQCEKAAPQKYSGGNLDDPWGWGPAARALFRATPTVFAALISGHVKLLKPAAKAVSHAIDEARKQRKASHSLVNKALDHIPVLGSAVAAVFNPFK